MNALCIRFLVLLSVLQYDGSPFRLILPLDETKFVISNKLL